MQSTEVKVDYSEFKLGELLYKKTNPKHFTATLMNRKNNYGFFYEKKITDYIFAIIKTYHPVNKTLINF